MFATILDAGTPATLAGMIRRAFGDCAAKQAAPYADASHRTVSDWIQRRSEPGAWKLMRMVRHPGFRAELRAYLDHIEQEEANIALQMDALAAQRNGTRAGGSGVSGASGRATEACAAVEAVGSGHRGVTR